MGKTLTEVAKEDAEKRDQKLKAAFDKAPKKKKAPAKKKAPTVPRPSKKKDVGKLVEKIRP